MVTWLALTVLVPLGLWLLGPVVDALAEQRYRAARARDQRIAEAILAEWLRLGEAVDLDPDEVVSAAERILRETRG